MTPLFSVTTTNNVPTRGTDGNTGPITVRTDPGYYVCLLEAPGKETDMQQSEVKEREDAEPRPSDDASSLKEEASELTRAGGAKEELMDSKPGLSVHAQLDEEQPQEINVPRAGKILDL